jgi:hypothetical protein
MKIIKRTRKKRFLNGMIFIEFYYWYFLTEKVTQKKERRKTILLLPFIYSKIRIFCCRPKGARDV